jgi:BirA family biotin operon repressor/biotin-[acetyl-CoA-carboxylase] ligase
VAGVLAEATDDGRERTVVVGIGVNANLEVEELADLPNATSLAIEAGHDVHRGELLALMLERFESWLGRDARQRDEGLWQAWNGRLWGHDQVVRVQDGREQISGVILGGDRDGTLMIRTTDGAVRRIVAGEILP